MQQINLYQDQFKPQREIPWLLICCVVLCVMFLAMYAVNWSQTRAVQELKTRLEHEQGQHQQMLESVEQLQQRLSARTPSESLINDVQLLQTELAQRQPLREALDQAMLQENTVPQSLEAFAVKPLKQLWLSRIVLMESGATIQLHGLTPHAKNIPTLIESLSSQEVFSQQRFSQLELERQEDGLYTFLLSTQRGGNDGSEE